MFKSSYTVKSGFEPSLYMQIQRDVCLTLPQLFSIKSSLKKEKFGHATARQAIIVWKDQT